MVVASDNPFPSVLFVEHVDPSTPAADTGRLFLDTDGILKWISDAGVVSNIAMGSALTDPMTSRGDIIIRNASNVTARLAKGTASQVLTSDGTDVAWATPSSGFTDPMTTRGDIIIRNAANATARLGRGTASQVFASDGTDVAWTSTLAPTSLNANGLLRFGASLDSTVNADQNDFAPAGIHTVSSIRFTSFSANRTITGIDAGSGGEVLILQNNTSFSMLLTHESASSVAANRFRNPNAATVTCRQQGTIFCVYIAGRWCTLGA